MADVVILMKDGRIEQSGSPADLYQDPATAFSASFIGTPPMTLLPAAGVPDALVPELLQSKPRESLVLGIRPESVAVAANASGVLRGKVKNAEFMGAETFVYADTTAGPLVARISGRVSCDPDEEIFLAWNRNDAVLFDKESGTRLPVKTNNGAKPDRVQSSPVAV
jgi:sn-glycerol 3-phosphate transport system ATP-binding protein